MMNVVRSLSAPVCSRGYDVILRFKQIGVIGMSFIPQISGRHSSSMAPHTGGSSS